MEIYGIEKLSLVDYDGKIATTLFTGSCNFRCGFCHNSALVTGVSNLQPNDLDEVFDYLKKRTSLLEGVCITGGEPTLQKDLPEFCARIKELGYSVKIDTNGTNPEMIKTLNENCLADYFAMDIKNDLDNYSEIIGVKNFDTKNVEKSVEYFLSGKANYEFRTTLIKEYHSEENVRKIGEWIKGANKYLLQKFKPGENCISNNLSGIDEETANSYLEILKKYVNQVGLRGY